MEPAFAKLSTETMILFCLLFAPPGEKQTHLDVLKQGRPEAMMVVVRTDSGFDIFNTVRLGKHAQTSKRYTVTAVKDKPFVFEFKHVRFPDKNTRVDLSAVAKAIKPLTDAPDQVIRLEGAKDTVVASGKVVYVSFHHKPLTFVIHGSGAPAKGKPKAGVAAGEKFWDALAKGDTDAMEGYYAAKVTLKAGSELLRMDSVYSGEEGKDAVVVREKLIAGYRKLIGAAGKGGWAERQSSLSVTAPGAREFLVADKPDAVISGTRKG
ncbi:hypothetical protein LCGC14_1878340, partial [marine sediment metagenome]